MTVPLAWGQGANQMGYCRFLADLFDDGRVAVPQFAPLANDELRAGDALIAEFESNYRLEMPWPAPRFLAVAGRFAAVQFFRACQFAVYRDAGADLFDRELSLTMEGCESPETHYSVDLLFRYLPDLVKFARSAAAQDPLVEHLFRWARDWPLSSVGIPNVGDVRINGFADNAALLRLYADRVIASEDKFRLSDPRVREAVAAAVGMFPSLAPRMHAHLAECTAEESAP